MNYSRVQVMALVIAVYVLFPVAMLSSTFLFTTSSVAMKICYGVGLLTASFILFRIGYWEFLGLGVRYAFVLLAFGAAALPFVRPSSAEAGGSVFALVVGLDILLLVEGGAILRAGKRPAVSLDVRLPFRAGRYLITDGGNGRASRLVNYHYRASVHKGASTNRAMGYAVDMVKTDRLGFTTKGFVPPTVQGYLIFGEPIVSPIAGVVAAITDGIDDNVPFCGKYPYNVGNNVVIRVDHTYVVLGHLRNRSITVKVGDNVQPGDAIGRIGNSGLSERPHLHMQASRAEDGNFWKGEGISILFEGSIPVKGRVFRGRM
jgi:hypothetical protein